MNVFVSNKELIEVTDGLVRKTYGDNVPYRIDVQKVAEKGLGLNVCFERFVEHDPDKVAFISDGKSSLSVLRDGVKQSIVFPENVIVVDEFLRENFKDDVNFVIGHECGHRIYSNANPEKNRACYKRIFDYEKEYSVDEMNDRLNFEESMANSASYGILMPRCNLLKLLKEYNNAKKIVVYGNHTMMPETKLVLRAMMNAMNVSYTTLFIQLKKNDLIAFRDISEYVNRLKMEEYSCEGKLQ